MKKILAVLLSVAIMIFAPLSFAASNTQDNKNYSIIYDTLKTHNDNCEITVVSKSISVGSYVDDILQNIKKSGQYGNLLFNELLHYSPYIKGISFDNQQYILEINLSFEYYETKEQYQKAWEIVKNVVEENNLRSLTKQEQISFVYDYIASNTTYDYDMKAFSQSAYSCLVEHNSICAGISKAFDMFMIELGIDGFLVDETVEGHMYNKIYVNNKEYYCDITWDLDEPNGDYEWFMTETDIHL